MDTALGEGGARVKGERGNEVIVIVRVNGEGRGGRVKVAVAILTSNLCAWVGADVLGLGLGLSRLDLMWSIHTSE